MTHLIIVRRNHVLNEMSGEARNTVAYSNPDLPWAAGLISGIVGFWSEIWCKQKAAERFAVF